MFEISNSPHDMLCIQITNPDKKVSDFLRGIVMCNRIGFSDYEQSSNAGCFLQCDYEEYLLIEFRKKEGAQEFLDYANKKWEAEMAVIEIDNSTEYECFIDDSTICSYCGKAFDDPNDRHEICGLG
jgi:hypothetical protein